MNNPRGTLSKLGCIVREADCDEILEELVEPIHVAGRVGREVAGPLDCPLKRRISSALAMDIPPARRFQHDERVRRRLRTRQRTGQRSDLLRNVACVDVAGLRVRDIDGNLVDRDISR